MVNLPEIIIDLNEIRQKNPDAYSKWKFKLLWIDDKFEDKETIHFTEIFDLLGFETAAVFLADCGFEIDIEVSQKKD